MSIRTRIGKILKRLNIHPERRRLTKLGQTIDPQLFVHFIGNPRSGTTLVRSLLNAHPAITISQEQKVVAAFYFGERSWDYLCGSMLDNAARFDSDPVWNDYDYDIAFGQQNNRSELTIIGDKKSKNTAGLFGKNPGLCRELANWSPIPLRFIHCVRHPLDVIATKDRNNDMGADWNIARYFDFEDTALGTERELPDGAFHRLYLDDLVADPQQHLANLLDFLGVDVIPEYMAACADRVFDKPRKSRDAVEWTDAQLEAVQAGVAKREHLHRYQRSISQ